MDWRTVTQGKRRVLRLSTQPTRKEETATHKKTALREGGVRLEFCRTPIRRFGICQSEGSIRRSLCDCQCHGADYARPFTQLSMSAVRQRLHLALITTGEGKP